MQQKKTNSKVIAKSGDNDIRSRSKIVSKMPAQSSSIIYSIAIIAVCGILLILAGCSHSHQFNLNPEVGALKKHNMK